MPFLLRHVPCLQGRFPCRESGRRVLHLVVEGLGPEPRETIRIRRVEYNLSLRSHWIPGRRRTGCYLDTQPPTEGARINRSPRGLFAWRESPSRGTRTPSCPRGGGTR